MMLIVCSLADLASKNIFELYTQNFRFVEKNGVWKYRNFVLVLIKEDLVNAKFIEKEFPEADLVIFASKHSSERKVPCLTVHSDGNWGKATLGGKDYTISYAPALYMKKALIKLHEFKNENNLDRYQVTLEVTHHGPNLNKPSLWIEVGSSEKEWNDLKACEAVCEAILSLEDVKSRNEKVIVGFGGSHYAPGFTKLVLSKGYAVGHIIPKYSLDIVPDRLIEEAYLKTVPNPDFGVIDWKGTRKSQRGRILKIFDKNGWEVRKLKDLE